ncbi:hypothetical protein [Nocardioides yefusunii]|uniref:Mce-associated membrane protein n=1 Tax=Nocardioides yefusunii TaxID=2500546 RepID=A0ABW1QYV0_9ACTN|nr:hypothetical protein [Nocardioides yefusunii]
MPRNVSRRRRCALVTSFLALVPVTVAAVAGCSAGSEPRVGEVSTSSLAAPTQATEPVDVALQVRVGKLEGYLPAARQESVVAEVGAVADGWIEQAWVAGPWPRTVSDVWGAFTPEAARSAEADASATSAAGHAERVSAVRVARRDVTVDLLAQQGSPLGATARVALSFDVTPTTVDDGSTRKVALRGRVMLTPTAGGWKIFGHDLVRGGW